MLNGVDAGGWKAHSGHAFGEELTVLVDPHVNVKVSHGGGRSLEWSRLPIGRVSVWRLGGLGKDVVDGNVAGVGG